MRHGISAQLRSRDGGRTLVSGFLTRPLPAHWGGERSWEAQQDGLELAAVLGDFQPQGQCARSSGRGPGPRLRFSALRAELSAPGLLFASVGLQTPPSSVGPSCECLWVYVCAALGPSVQAAQLPGRRLKSGYGQGSSGPPCRPQGGAAELSALSPSQEGAQS